MMMTIHDERPEDELHEARASELLTVIAMILSKTNGHAGIGSIPCPVCREGVIVFAITTLAANGDRPRRSIAARCGTSGCIAFERAPEIDSQRREDPPVTD